jgi:hypothetical protein
MVLLDFSMTPFGKGENVSRYLARCLEVVAASGLDSSKSRSPRTARCVLDDDHCEAPSSARENTGSLNAVVYPHLQLRRNLLSINAGTAPKSATLNLARRASFAFICGRT